MSVLLVLVSILFKFQFHIYLPHMCLIPSIFFFNLFTSGLIPPPPPNPIDGTMWREKSKIFLLTGERACLLFLNFCENTNLSKVKRISRERKH